MTKNLLFLILLLPMQLLSQTVCLSPAEQELYVAIMAYRSTKNLSEIPLSLNLTKVAQMHVQDLHTNRPFSQKCNMHSWSKKGALKACCYTDDHSKASCMWNKPRELSNYKGDGYEIAHGYSNYAQYPGVDVTPQQALDGWKKSKGHNMVIMNKGMWSNVEWKAVGIGMYKDFAVVWFGRETDADIPPEKCTE